MEKPAPPATKPLLEATRPRFLDYVLIFVGVSLSVVLGEMSGVQARPAQAEPSTLEIALARVFPALMFMSLGVVLLWPIFYMSQKLLGRKRELTWAEWLWGLGWLGSMILALWLVWKGLGPVPEFMGTAAFNNGIMVAYVLFVLSMGGLATLMFLVGILGRLPVPWTHTFGLALLMWPLVPLAAWWLLGIKLE